MSFVFGPVPSRRLGRSLGVDLVPFKTCTYDCIYCQLGRTTDRTITRRDRVDRQAVLDDLQQKLVSEPEYITLSGSGEPTLHLGLGELIDQIHSLTDIPVAVLTNGSLLWQPELRRELRNADLVIPSLDAGGEQMFQAVNRSHPDLSFDLLIEGLIDFREEFDGDYWLEIMLLGGYTSTKSEVSRISQLVERIDPDKVQINTVTRPPSEEFATGIGYSYLQQLASIFSRPVELVADLRGSHCARVFGASRDAVVQMLSRRPCTVDEISAGLGMHRNEVVKYLEQLQNEQSVRYRLCDGKLYYVYAGTGQ